ncbi:MAG: glycerol-3-phosphate 1-O-acyltransferase PlsY [Pseudomonadota bacterium]|nr:glycerol-3-phosphate 1-O-acyltransferase PlsY [Gammaproteobacteria bacterium]MBU1558772.1 glycerol-3-phosphate 1-O-acyltransferase PlsY [Gammaproteobacteria bacterium]MBU1926758.1 glycerol-3-phosphate 1-O-acyltransferase PlsY [Gammaproteobacteria bacterium]MBU2546264.1 glycerol-3-phosphate 1-O-acyltransferase PlsY [Gammaproteobacteria bacterium]
MNIIIAFIIAYLLGSVSTSILVCKLAKLPDPRSQGSGNAGATNMLRFAGKKLALLTLAGDMLKGVLAVLIARWIGVMSVELGIVAFIVFLGHVYPIYFRFQGGKGVATFLGALLALSPLTGALALITWVVVALVFRYSSLASIIVALLTPFYIFVLSNPAYVLGLVLISLLLIWRHRKNIDRLRLRSEPKIGR